MSRSYFECKSRKSHVSFHLCLCSAVRRLSCWRKKTSTPPSSRCSRRTRGYALPPAEPEPSLCGSAPRGGERAVTGMASDLLPVEESERSRGWRRICSPMASERRGPWRLRLPASASASGLQPEPRQAGTLGAQDRLGARVDPLTPALIVIGWPGVPPSWGPQPPLSSPGSRSRSGDVSLGGMHWRPVGGGH